MFDNPPYCGWAWPGKGMVLWKPMCPGKGMVL
jgi:hypothetical protein